MKLILTLILFTGFAFAQDLEQLRREASAAFAQDFGPGGGEIVMELSPSECLRTGYQRSTRKVIFCPGPRVIQGGRESVDVINHEFFHALFCGQRPELCATSENDYLHEAFADAFAYRLNPDDNFGENFYTDRAFIRKYQTDWLPELVQSEHEKGSAIAARIIRSDKPLSDFLSLFSRVPESFVKVFVGGAPYSVLNRYRLRVDQTLNLSFLFDASARVAGIDWQTPAGIEVETSKFSTSVRVTGAFRGGKSYVRFLSAEGKELGRWTFYFGREL